MRIDGGAVVEGYEAVLEAVGFFEMSDQGKIEVKGPDRVTFLHSMISNDVDGLMEWNGHYGAFLTARGRIVSDFHYYKLPDYIIIDVRNDLLGKTIQTLEKYVVMDEVYLEDISATKRHFSLQGPRSLDLLQALFGSSGPSTQYGMQEQKWEDQLVWVIRKDQISRLGFEIILSLPVGDRLQQAILEKGERLGLQRVSEAALEILRVESKLPRYGVDMDENRYPMEAQLHEAISLTKGCYIGQEVVAKATHVGGVANLLMGLKFKDSVVPPKDSPVKDGDKQIGIITSAVFSPRLRCPIALAYLKRPFARAGEQYNVDTDEREGLVAEVVEKFT